MASSKSRNRPVLIFTLAAVPPAGFGKKIFPYQRYTAAENSDSIVLLSSPVRKPVKQFLNRLQLVRRFHFSRPPLASCTIESKPPSGTVKSRFVSPRAAGDQLNLE